MFRDLERRRLPDTRSLGSGRTEVCLTGAALLKRGVKTIGRESHMIPRFARPESSMIPRYTRPEMAAIWEPLTRFKIWFEIEAHAADAQAELGVIPKEAAKRSEEHTS